MECMKDAFIKGQLLHGRYRSVAPLNHGSFGMVFLADDITTSQQVAIKCLTKPAATAYGPSTLAPDEGAEELACFSILRKHDHLVNLVDHFETDAHTFLVLEYCTQGDLYEAIRVGRGPLETEHVRSFLLQLISAVDHMHAHGLYHRDIKPENIFLAHDGSMKLGDFGLATKNSWCYESCVGSDRYMAPEQYDPAGAGYDPAKADIWSIGICLLNVLFSRNPFVTPTDSDILFADYRRDRQSLFDIFTNMSQDTFEVLSIALAMDPAKRDLSALRQAVLRVVSFTTDDESLDEFCVEEREPVRASADREPLRTPSIQSPQINAGDSFPWAKALHGSPHPRQLSAIADTELTEEDLFPVSEGGPLARSWYSGYANTPSRASVLDSTLGVSVKSIPIRRPDARGLPRSDPVPISGSLPIQGARPILTMTSIFGKKRDTVAKSWSDLWDEEESEQEEAMAKEMGTPTHRSWSQESKLDLTVRPGILTEAKSQSSSNVRRSLDPRPLTQTKRRASPNENEPFTARGPNPRSAPDKGLDKWEALGNKRRNYQPAKEDQAPGKTKKRSMTSVWRKDPNHGSSGYDYSSWYRRDSRSGGRPCWLDHDWRQHPLPQHKRSMDGFADEDEWVGGWQHFHV